MVDISNVNNLNFSEAIKLQSFNTTDGFDTEIESTENQDVSIFSSDSENIEDNVEVLQQQLAEIEAENGAILDGWNNFKEKIGIGTSASKCDEAISQYANGEISYEEAYETIEKFGNKQESSLNLFSNIATGAAAIAAVAGVAAVVAATGGAALPVIAAVGIGAATGAVTKAGFKTADRATNEVEGDALDAKQIAHDALSGAVVGGTAALTMGTGGGTGCVAKSVKTGIEAGAVAGGANYSIDCAFDDDKTFSVGEFAQSTATGALIGGATGAIMGSVSGALKNNGIVTSGCNIKTMVSSAGSSVQDVAANSASSTGYKIVNDRISSIVNAI